MSAVSILSFVIAWWDDSINTTNLSVIIKPESGIITKLLNLDLIHRVTIGGSYGKDLDYTAMKL
jgi:hypothetical protein